MIILEHINKVYHNKHNDKLALNDISFTIKDNKGITFILGASGSGKSTLLNIIAGTDNKYEGKRVIKGKVVYVTQDFRLFDDMTLVDNLYIISKDTDKINILLNTFGLYEHRKTKVYRLSNGQKKRLEFIKAILLEPDILLCDEITSALDHDNAIIVMDVLKSLSKAMSIVIVTHDEDIALKYADRIIRVNDGIMISDTTYNADIKTKTLKKTGNKRSFKDHISFTYKEMTSKVVHYLLFVIVLFLSITAIFSSISLYKTIREENSYANSFKYGRNIIENKPKFFAHNISTDVKHIDMATDIWDYFKVDEIDKVLESDDVIAIAPSFDFRKIEDQSLDIFDDIYSFKHYLFDQEEYYGIPSDIRIKPVSKPFLFIEDDISNYAVFDDQIDSDGKEITVFSGYELLNEGSISEDDRYIYDTNNFDLYYLIDKDVELNLISGNMPKIENEIVINKKLAEYYIQMLGLEDINDLIGKELIFRCYADVDSILTTDIIDQLEERYPSFSLELYCQEFRYMISGISGLDVNERMVAYSIEDYKDNQIINTYRGIEYPSQDMLDRHLEAWCDDEESCQYVFSQFGRIYFESLSFMIDPSADTEAFITELNDTFKPMHDSFVSASATYDENNILYKNVSTYYPFIILTTVLVLLVPFIILIFKRKKEAKEIRLMKIYGYKVGLVYILRSIFLAILTIVISLLAIYLITLFVNNYALTYGYNSFIAFDVVMIVLISIVMVILTIVFKRIVAR